MFRTMTMIVLLTISVSGLIISKVGHDTPPAPTFQQALAAGSIEGLLLQYALKELDVDPSQPLNEDTIGKLIDVVQDRDFDSNLSSMVADQGYGRDLYELTDGKVKLSDIADAKRKLLTTLQDFKTKAPGLLSRAKREAPGLMDKISRAWDDLVDTVKEKWDAL